MSKIIGIDLNPAGCSTAVLEAANVIIIGKLPKELSVKDNQWYAGLQPEADSAIDISTVLYKLGATQTIRFGKSACPPIVLLSAVLLELKRMAEDYLGETVQKAVVAVPNWFHYNMKREIEKSGSLAGLEIVRILKRSSAFSLWDIYSTDPRKAELVASVHIDPHGWDISLCEEGDGLAEELAAAGGPFPEQYSIPDNSSEPYWLPAKAQMNNIFKEIQQTFRSRSDLKAGRVMLFQREKQDNELIHYVRTQTGRNPVLTDSIEDAYVKGAALCADKLSGGISTRDLLCISCLSEAVSLETAGGGAEPLISIYSAVPIKKSQIFSTAVDNQTALDIHLLSGDKPRAGDNIPIGNGYYQVKLPPFLKKGVPRIEITIAFDANEHLNVSARNANTDQYLKVFFVGQAGMSERDKNLWSSVLQNYPLRRVQPSRQQTQKEDPQQAQKADRQQVRLLQNSLHLRPGTTVTELFESILPVLDALDASMDTLTPDMYGEPYVLFFLNLRQNMLKALAAEGLQPIPDTGRPFDYRYHKAVSTAKSKEVPPGTIIRPFRTGYEYRGKVLRYSEVEVAEP